MYIRALLIRSGARLTVWLATAHLWFFATSVTAEIVPLPHLSDPIELVDTEERISGNATTGLTIVYERFEPDRDNLWAYIGAPVPAAVEVQISSVDGRYVARLEYDTHAIEPGWTALALDLERFSVLRAYDSERVAALLIDRDGTTVFPLWWGPRHRDLDSTDALPALTAATLLRAYVNTERATAFVVALDDGAETPVVCRDVPGGSGFKFNALCEVSLGGISYRRGAPDAPVVVDGFDVLRRAGTRSLSPIPVTLSIEY